MKIRIDADVYDIVNRIKKIDRDYCILFDTDKESYELHNFSQRGSTYCLSIPYPFLDYRVIELIGRTSSKNIDKIIAEIDNENKIKESADKTSTLNFLRDVVKDGRLI